MAITTELIEQLGSSKHMGERRLAKQVLRYVSDPSLAYKGDLISRKLYLTLLSHIDDTTKDKLLELEKGIKALTFHFMGNGWFVNNNGAKADEEIPYEERNTPNLWTIIRDEEGFHTLTNKPQTPHQEVIRYNEESYFAKNAIPFQELHNLMLERDTILANRAFVPKVGSEYLVDLLLQAIGVDNRIVKTKQTTLA